MFQAVAFELSATITCIGRYSRLYTINFYCSRGHPLDVPGEPFVKLTFLIYADLMGPRRRRESYVRHLYAPAGTSKREQAERSK